MTQYTHTHTTPPLCFNRNLNLNETKITFDNQDLLIKQAVLTELT